MVSSPSPLPSLLLPLYIKHSPPLLIQPLFLGSYTLETLIGAQEYRDGLRLLPDKVAVEITSTPRHDVEFHQGLAKLRGSVKCIGGDCNSVKIQVREREWDCVGYLQERERDILNRLRE